MRIVDLSQGSDGWHSWRGAGIGASDSCIIVHGEHFGRNRESLWREKLGIEQRKSGNWAMRQGQATEAETRVWYEQVTGHDAPPVCALHDEYDWLKASLDGWVPSAKTIVEFKYASRPRHEAALAGEVPEEYKPQLTHQWLVAGPDACHYVSFNPRFPEGERRVLVPWAPTPDGLAEHFRLVDLFWRSVVSKTPPKDQEYVSISRFSTPP